VNDYCRQDKHILIILANNSDSACVVSTIGGQNFDHLIPRNVPSERLVHSADGSFFS
jgi:hypothetical protein